MIVVKAIKDNSELEKVIKDINSRLDAINHYLQEWEAMMNFLSEKKGVYEEYHLFLKYFRRAYLDMVFLNLNIIFDKNSVVNIFRINDFISKNNEFIKNLKLNDEFERVIFSVNKIRNKAVAHIDDFDINNIYRQFKVSKQHLDNIIFYIDKRLECLIRHSELNFTKNELIYLEGEGIHAILNLLPEKNPYAKSAKGIRLERQFDYICEIT